MGKGSNTGFIFLGAGTILALLLLSKSKDEKKNDVPNTGIKFTGKATDFIIAMTPYAREAHKLFPQVPIELMLAFSGLESGWGRSAPKFNFFGTKPGKNYPGKIQTFDTTEVLPRRTGYTFPKVYSITPRQDGKFTWKVADNFRAFDTPLEAYIDFCKFITGGRYKGAYAINNIRDIVTAVWKAGYATDPDYVNKIMKLVGTIQEVIRRYT